MSFDADEQKLQALDKLIDLAERIEAKLGASSQSSVEVKTSTRGADIAVKVYAGSPLGGLGDEALAEYTRLVLAAEESVMRGMAKQVDTLRGRA